MVDYLGIELSEVCNSRACLIILLNQDKRRGNECTLTYIAHWVIGQRLQQSNSFLESSPGTRNTQSQCRTIPRHTYATYHGYSQINSAFHPSRVGKSTLTVNSSSSCSRHFCSVVDIVVHYD